MNRQRERRATQMGVASVDELPGPDPWVKPEPDACESWPVYKLTPGGADPQQDRILVRVLREVATDEMVEFAVVHETFYGKNWYPVALVDSCHDDDIHLHYYARSTKQRIGEPDVLMAVNSQADIQTGYDMAYPLLDESWAKNLERWHHG